MAVQTQIQTRRGTAASWTSTNPTLAAGEIGFESDTGKFKIGNGSTAWASLAYATNGAAVSPLTTKGDLYTYSTADARLAVGNNGETLVADSSASTGLRYQANFAAGKNAIINGALDIWQRGTSFTAIGYVADRWYYASGATGRTVTQQASALTGFRYCIRSQRDSGNTITNSYSIRQNLETVNSLRFAGQTVTVSFYARCGADYSAASNGLVAQLKSGTGTDQNSAVSYTGEINVINQTATLTTTWQRFSYTATVGSTANELSLVFISVPTGTAGANDFFEVTGIQLETGSVATAFQTATGTIQGELAACQRYYYRKVAPENFADMGLGFAISTTSARIEVTFPVYMRVQPNALDYSTLILYDGSGTNVTVTSAGLSEVNNQSTRLTIGVASGLTQYRPYSLLANNSTSAYVGFSAEL